MKEDEPEKYEAHFSRYIKAGIEADGLEELYKKVTGLLTLARLGACPPQTWPSTVGRRWRLATAGQRVCGTSVAFPPIIVA